MNQPLSNASKSKEASEESSKKGDHDLVQRVQAGDSAAFRTLFDKYHRRAFAVAMGVVKSEDDALDAVQKSLEAGLPAPIPPIFNLVILHWPHPGADIMLPLFGVGDLIFIAFFLAVCQRFALSLQKGALLVLAGLGISILVTIFVQRPIPALPFICGIFLVGNFSSIRKPLPGNHAR